MVTVRFYRNEELLENLIHEVEAEMVPHKGDSVCFWDTGTLEVQYAE